MVDYCMAQLANANSSDSSLRATELSSIALQNFTLEQC